MLPNKFSWRFLEKLFSLVTLACLFFSEDLFGYIPGIATITMQSTHCPEADVYENNKPHQKCWFIGFLKRDTNLTKEGCFSSKLFQIVSIPVASVQCCMCMNNRRTTQSSRPRLYTTYPTAQNAFQAIPGLVTCAGVTDQACKLFSSQWVFQPEASFPPHKSIRKLEERT